MTYDVIVIGAGHAGCEAALAAARMGCKTLLVTLNLDYVALLPCNPAVGGPGKSHLVREVDALGGEIGLNTDKTFIQMRMLNTGKGPAVRALRAQVDKVLYQREMLKTLQGQRNLDLKQGSVERLLISKGEVIGVQTQTGARYKSKTVVLTTGTYLCGRIIIGEISYAGGPNSQRAPQGLAESLLDLGFELMRFKTGTPPRVDRKSIDFSKMIEQPGDREPLFFSYLSKKEERPQLSCWLTHSNEQTHDIVRENLHRSPLFSRNLEGAGPRYCPSFEDKVVNFPGRRRHQIFLEPEGWDTDEYYVQGMYTSLPEDIQLAALRTIPGMEDVQIIRAGYGIEYDALVPAQLESTLQTKEIKGFFTAGQINGTSGYEEAAAQGILAGINAALFVHGCEPLVLKRSEAYIGVLVDDLITKGVREPYLFFYLLVGIIGSIAHIISAPGSDVPIIGASGAIAGILGAYILAFPRARILTLVPVFFFITFIQVPALIFLPIWFLIQILNALSTAGMAAEAVAWWAHIGGFIAGAILYPFFSRYSRYHS
jgi:tRNA uridine 5-carboxymethylaminomethyl modification enzyme